MRGGVVMAIRGLFVLLLTFALISCGGSDRSATKEAAVEEVPTAENQAVDNASSPAQSSEGSKSQEGQADLAITDVRKEDGGKYSATLNGAIVFRDLELGKSDDGKERLFFPKTPGKGRDGKGFPTVYLKDRSIADQIKDAIKAGKAGGKAGPGLLKVTAVRWKASSREGKLKGFADVMFNDAVEIKGFRLLEGGKNGIWLAWPSVKKGDEFVDLIFSKDKGVKDMVEAEVKKEAGL